MRLKMVYNAKYNRWVSRNGLVYRYCKGKDKLVLCADIKHNVGYVLVSVKKTEHTNLMLKHRLVWETFNGEIPDGLEIDHIDTNKENNDLSNLRLVTKKQNMNNPLTLKKLREISKCKNKFKPFTSEFARKFKEHFNLDEITDKTFYYKEKRWYKNHGKKCRWEDD